MNALLKIWAAVPPQWKEYLKAGIAAYLGYSFGPQAAPAAKSIFSVLAKFLVG